MPWNFAYGSNMHPDRLRWRADCHPRRRAPAVLREWRLAFNLATGLGFVEPAMANIIPSPGGAVHGVALEMSSAELDSLIRSEGGTRFYEVKEVTIETYAGETISARAFVAREELLRSEAPPSERYLGLLRAGARVHGLEEAYCAFLEDHAAAPPSPLAPVTARLFRTLDQPRMRRGRDAFLWLIERWARLEARRHQP